jgi:hypothetical protein
MDMFLLKKQSFFVSHAKKHRERNKISHLVRILLFKLLFLLSNNSKN